ncbi:MFS transporter [Legionella brunensis]|uniref:Beta lactamase induction signal transducer AmpG n=1 Tax=Legionella brunensis TaxID=29422 RepID=A0A0W0SP52_9GAMM|nr:MFS transporter [Legionella brunensis]KTC85178.1 beta lactamase induction signal transducer AmpG [Legionella brunensis]
MHADSATKPFQWVCSLYFFQSIPFVVVSLITTIIYQQLGFQNDKITLWASLLMLPWAIKPFFAPFLEIIATKKKLTITTQALLSLLFLVLALSSDSRYFLVLSSVCFVGIAFVSSLHDIVSDGVYILNLKEEEQKRYVAIRSFFYQMGRLVIKGFLLTSIAQIALHYHFNVWQVFFYSLFMLGFLLTVYHGFKLPEKEAIKPKIKKEYGLILSELITNKALYVPLLYIFLFNFADAQLQKIIPLFLLDETGLNLNLSQVGKIYGILGGVALMLGIFVSGFLMTRFSLSYCIKKFSSVLFLSPLLFLLLTLGEMHPVFIYVVIAFYQFVLGLANGAYMGYLLFIANKNHYPMSMYTFCTSAMALSYVFWGALSGIVQQQLGYSFFFIYLLIINSFLIMMTYRMMSKNV